MVRVSLSDCIGTSRSSHEERGLKSQKICLIFLKMVRRSSHEERGLKFFIGIFSCQLIASLLSRGAWIEMLPLDC